VVQVVFGIKTSRSERQWSSYELPPTEGQRVEFSRVSPTTVTGRYRGQDWHRALRPRGLISKFRVSLYGVVSSLFTLSPPPSSACLCSSLQTLHQQLPTPISNTSTICMENTAFSSQTTSPSSHSSLTQKHKPGRP